MNQLSHNACMWVLRHKECNCLGFYEWYDPPDRKMAFLPNTQILWKYRWIFSRLWLLYYTLCSDTLILQEFLILHPFFVLSHSFLLPSKVSAPSTVPWTQHLCLCFFSYLYQINKSKVHVVAFHPKSGLPHQYPASYLSQKKELSFSPKTCLDVSVLPMGDLVL